ncbi:MAG: hypothetical protein ABI378_09215 [Chitinophagaceae bacterium]
MDKRNHIILYFTSLLLTSCSVVHAQKSEYDLDKLFLIFNEAEWKQTFDIPSAFGHDSVVTYNCDGKLVIDEQGHTIKGNFSFLCDQCAQEHTTESLDFVMEKLAEGVYTVTNVLSGRHPGTNPRNEYTFSVNSTNGWIRVSFNYIGVQEQLFYLRFVGGKEHHQKKRHTGAVVDPAIMKLALPTNKRSSPIIITPKTCTLPISDKKNMNRFSTILWKHGDLPA